MSKRITIALTVFVVILFFVDGAFAYDFTAFYPVKGLDLKAETHEFNYNETPFIYAKLANPNHEINFFSDLYTKWYFADVKKDDENRHTLDQVEFWLASDKWPTIRQLGVWDITGNFTLQGQYLVVGAGSTSFTVRSPNTVPEPVSTFLFLAGGVALTVSRTLRKK